MRITVHAEATFDGEELTFTGVSCGTLPADDDDEIRGRIDGGGHLQARFTDDPDASDGDDIVLASEDGTQAPETHPDGGEVELDLRCG